MEKRIIWEMPDGTISITTSAIGSDAESLDKVEARMRIANPGYADATRHPDRYPDEFPQSRRFRSCWRLEADGLPAVDMSLARDQRLKEIRTERDILLQSSDGPMARATETGVGIQAMKDFRQQLRELPNQMESESVLDAVATPEALEAYQPIWPVDPGATS